jgi:hypothetical protein
MRWSLSDRSYPELLLLALGVSVLATLVVAASISGTAFGAYTLSWDGTSELRSEADAEAELFVTTDTSRYEEVPADGTVAIVLSPDEPYDEAERERIEAFVEDGGTLVVADAYGPHGNALLEDVGATARFDGDPLRDEQHYHQSPTLPVATNVSDHPFVSESETLTLNHGTAVEPGEATALVRSSEYAYLDRNRNQELDDDETMMAYPVVTAEDVGDGQVVAVSDPSVFINVMLERPGNRAFAQSLFAVHDRVIFDATHGADPPPLATVSLALRDSAVLQVLLGGGVILAIALGERSSAMRRLYRRVRSRFDEEGQDGLTAAEMEEVLATRYPSWDPERRERVVTAIMSRRRKDGNDD